MQRKIVFRICRLVLIVCILALSFDWTGFDSKLAASPLSGVAAGLILGFLPVLAAFVLVGSLLKRRWFCTFGCPLGYIQDATVWVRRYLYFLPQGRWVGRVLRTVPDLKYALLILCLAGICRFIPVSLIWLDPPGLFNAVLVAGLQLDFLKGTVIWTPGMILVPGIFVLSFLTAPKFWCMKICPTGALQEILFLPMRAVKKTVKRCVADDKPKDSENSDQPEVLKKTYKPENGAPERLVKRRNPARWSIVQNGLGLLAFAAWGLSISRKSTGSSSSSASKSEKKSAGNLEVQSEVQQEVQSEVQQETVTETEPNSETANADCDLNPIQPDWKFPPGALAVREEFVALCIRCGNCIGNCPTGLIQPISFESSNGYWGVPRLEFEQPSGNYAFCEENCVRCTQSCPTGALTVLNAEEKKERKLGKATLEFGLCRLFWEKECRICLRECPQEAITFRWSEEEYLTIPEINLDLCNGCGRCAARCPGDNYWELELPDPPPRRKALKIV